MLGGGSQPYAVVGGVVLPVAQNQYDLLPDIDRQTTKHGTRRRGERGERVEDELVRDDPARLALEKSIARGATSWLAASHGHRSAAAVRSARPPAISEETRRFRARRCRACM